MNTGGRVLTLLMLVVSSTLQAEANEPIAIGHSTIIDSKVLGEERKVLIAEPYGYASSVFNYPVLYLLDADANFQMTTGVVSSLVRGQKIPPVFVVGISNTDRRRDFTLPTRDESQRKRNPTHGGADKFLEFVSEELRSHMDENYRTHPYNILVGHSLGGLFTANAMLDKPDAFDAHIIISPALEWDHERTVDKAEAYFSTIESLSKTLYLAIGNEGGPMLSSTRRLVSVLDLHVPVGKGLVWNFDRTIEESHMTVPLDATRRGLRLIFSDWSIDDPVKLYDIGGMGAINKFYERADARYRTDRGTPANAFPILVAYLISYGRLDDAYDVLMAGETQKTPRQIDRLAMAYETKGQKDKAVHLFRYLYREHPKFGDTLRKLERLGADPNSVEPSG